VPDFRTLIKRNGKHATTTIILLAEKAGNGNQAMIIRTTVKRVYRKLTKYGDPQDTVKKKKQKKKIRGVHPKYQHTLKRYRNKQR
jgi:hypothetical protein